MQEKNCLTLMKKLLRDWYNAVFRLGHETHNVFEKKNLKGKSLKSSSLTQTLVLST